MKTLVVGDVHGCSDELQALTEEARADRVILVGDLFTKGPDPLGVWNQIRHGAYESVLGNHDQRLLEAASGGRKGDTEAHEIVRAMSDSEGDWLTWLENRPLFQELDGFLVVHAGLHPVLGRAGTTKKMAISMRRWPSEEPHEKHWYQQYQGEQGVIFGHDAKGGLVTRFKDQRPWLVGLDTGCVYGGRLSGFLVETAEFIHIKAKCVYRPI